MSIHTISLPDVAKELGCCVPTLRAAIKRECSERVSDSIRFCPGGRVFGTKYIVYRNIYETVRDAKAIGAINKAPIPFLKSIQREEVA